MGMVMRHNRREDRRDDRGPGGDNNHTVAKTATVAAVASPGPGNNHSVAKTAAVVAVATPGRGRPGPGR